MLGLTLRIPSVCENPSVSETATVTISTANTIPKNNTHGSRFSECFLSRFCFRSSSGRTHAARSAGAAAARPGGPAEQPSSQNERTQRCVSEEGTGRQRVLLPSEGMEEAHHHR